MDLSQRSARPDVVIHRSLLGLPLFQRSGAATSERTAQSRFDVSADGQRLLPPRTQRAGHGCWKEWRAPFGPSSRFPRYGSGTGSRSMTQPTAVTHLSTSRARTPAIGVLPCSLSVAHPVSPSRKSPSHPSPRQTTEPLSVLLIMTISPTGGTAGCARYSRADPVDVRAVPLPLATCPHLRYRDQSEKDDTRVLRAGSWGENLLMRCDCSVPAASAETAV
jgi:hypothetical protein